MICRMIEKGNQYIEAIKARINYYIFKKKFKFIGHNCQIKGNTKFHNPQYITIGDGFSVESGVKIDAWDKYKAQNFTPKITIGKDVSMNIGCYISAINEIVIGNGVMMGRNVFITDHSHGRAELYKIRPAERELFSKGSVRIGNHVWIGSNVCIMPGVSIGDNCIIGANSVVTHSIEKNMCVAGVPARTIKEKLVERL